MHLKGLRLLGEIPRDFTHTQSNIRTHNPPRAGRRDRQLISVDCWSLISSLCPGETSHNFILTWHQYFFVHISLIWRLVVLLKPKVKQGVLQDGQVSAKDACRPRYAAVQWWVLGNNRLIVMQPGKKRVLSWGRTQRTRGGRVDLFCISPSPNLTLFLFCQCYSGCSLHHLSSCCKMFKYLLNKSGVNYTQWRTVQRQKWMIHNMTGLFGCNSPDV